MGMIPYDVRSTVSRYSSCSEHSTTIHAFRSATNEGVSSRPMNDIRNSMFARLGTDHDIRNQWFFAILEAMTTD